MTTNKTKLVWRLKEQPTTESLRELVKDKILTNEEAREMLFSSEDQTQRDVKSLEAEIKFLRQLIENLSSRPQVVEIIGKLNTPYYYNQPWYQPYQVWCSTAIATTTEGHGSTMLNTAGTANFSNIKTF